MRARPSRRPSRRPREERGLLRTRSEWNAAISDTVVLGDAPPLGGASAVIRRRGGPVEREAADYAPWSAQSADQIANPPYKPHVYRWVCWGPAAFCSKNLCSTS